MSYREQLPEGCPPDEAEEINTRREVFRLVRNRTPTEEDFRSQRAERPGYAFRGVTECQARGLSVHTERGDTAGPEAPQPARALHLSTAIGSWCRSHSADRRTLPPYLVAAGGFRYSESL
jgi:hypothetical protein